MARDGITTVTSPTSGRVSHRARCSWTDDAGVRQHRSKSFHTKKAAQKWRRDMLVSIDQGTLFEPQPVTVGVVADAWLATIERGKAPSTYVQYRHMWMHDLQAQMAHRKIASVKATEIQALYDMMGQTHAANTVRMAHKVLSGIMRHALADGLIRHDPTIGRRLPTDRRDPATVWTLAQAQRFIARTETDPRSPLFVLLVTTGLRLGEAQALHWADVDLDARTVRIHRTAQRSPDGTTISERPKTDRSNRTVVLPAVAVMALRRQRELTGTHRLVFVSNRGGILPGRTAQDRLHRLCELASVPDITPHGLRRTCATIMLQQGTHPSVAATMLGHSVQTMLTAYAQVSITMQSQAVAALDTALTGTTT